MKTYLTKNSAKTGIRHLEKTKMLLCPNCTEELKKNPKHAEGTFLCSECGEEWFILNIPTSKYLKRKVKDPVKEPDSFTKGEAKKAVKKVKMKKEKK